MNVEQSMCAASGLAAQWEQIDWSQCEQRVRRLQTRIVKATQEGRHGKVKALQWLLTHSFCGRALAVKRVTNNQGKNTPGVDGSDLEHSRVQIQGHRHTASPRLASCSALTLHATINNLPPAVSLQARMLTTPLGCCP